MTSKEALKEIKQAPTFMGGNPRYMYSTQSSEPFLEDIKVIEKDLEVLDIIKKYIYFSDKTHCIRMKDIYKRTTNFDFEILKELLEND